jgi:hypothetical protein
MKTLGPLDQYRAVQMLVNTHNLLVVDSVWTQQVEQTGVRSKEEVETLGQMASDIDRLLSLIQADAPWLRQFVEQNAEEFYATFTRLLADAHLDDKTRQELGRKFASSRDFADQIARSVQVIIDDTTQEREQIAEKMKRISAGRTSEGDVSKTTRCAVMLVGIGVGAALTFGGAALLGGFFMGAYGGLFVDEC